MASLNEVTRPWTQLPVNITASTDVLTAPTTATQNYTIWGINLSSSAILTLQFNQGTGPTALEGPRTMAVGVPLVLTMTPDIRPVFTLPAGAKFTLTQTGAGTIAGSIYYTLGPV